MPSASLTITSYEEDEYDDGSSGAGDGSARTAFISMPRHGGESARATRAHHGTCACTHSYRTRRDGLQPLSQGPGMT